VTTILDPISTPSGEPHTNGVAHIGLALRDVRPEQHQKHSPAGVEPAAVEKAGMAAEVELLRRLE
jgi:hypothetical protein